MRGVEFSGFGDADVPVALHFSVPVAHDVSLGQQCCVEAVGINNLQVLEDAVTCRTRLNSKRIRRLAVLGEASRFLAIPDHFGRINDNWSEPPIPGLQLQLPRRRCL